MIRIKNAILSAIMLCLCSTAFARPEFLYSQTNSSEGNEVTRYLVARNGELLPSGSFATAGIGTDGGLGNQSSLTITRDNRTLLVVNAGSNEVSSFAIKPFGLLLQSTVGSQGITPISVITHRNLAYVLNAGDDNEAGSIVGYRINRDGGLRLIENSKRLLPALGSAPAQIAFDQQGQSLIVTEKATNSLVTYTVDRRSGLATEVETIASSGQTPFGFAVTNQNIVLVSEAFGGAASALSSYSISRSGELSPVSPSIQAGDERAACWTVVTRNGRLAFTTNTATNSVSAYSVDRNGQVALLQETAGTASGAPIDMVLSRSEKYLIVLNASTDTFQSFAVARDGTLELRSEVTAPASANGAVVG